MCIIFNACDGIIEMILQSKEDYHATVPSETIQFCTKLGTFLQKSNILVERRRSLIKHQSTGFNMQKKVHGVDNIISS